MVSGEAHKHDTAVISISDYWHSTSFSHPVNAVVSQHPHVGRDTSPTSNQTHLLTWNQGVFTDPTIKP